MNNFFDNLVIKSGIGDQETMRNFYYALIKLIIEGLRKNESIYLPDWGEFQIKTYRERYVGDVNTHAKTFLPAQKIIKFKPCVSLKKYIKEIKS